jgi:ABC-type antimicrobial peptide transport system permease subunit
MEHRRTYRQGLFGREGTPIYFVSENDQRPFADRLGWNLVEGRWPRSGTNEMAMTQDILRNRGLGVGDLIGQAVDEDGRLNGEWLIVGALRGSIIGGIGDLGYLQDRFLDLPGQTESLEIQPGVLAVVAKPGGEAKLEALLETLPKDEVSVFYRSKAQRNFERLTTNIDTMLWILNAMSIAVMSLALGLLNVIFFMQRGNEFGLLAAIGYTKGILMRRVLLETTVTVIAGWAFGILLSIDIYSTLNSVIFVPRGLEALSVLTVRVLVYTLPVPIMVILFGVGVVLWQLHRMDPVAIIERRD